MFCGASAGEVSVAGEDPGRNKASAVYWCATCNYMYCSICSYRNNSCAEDEAVCVRCDNLMKQISQLLAYCRLDTLAMVRMWEFFSGRQANSGECASGDLKVR